MRYKTILADPPWPVRWAKKINDGVIKGYPLMTLEEIRMLPVWELADNEAHLYLWANNNFLKEGIEIMERWGFRYITNIAWIKDKIGLGQYFRNQHELLLFGVKGKLPIEGTFPSIIKAKRHGHSRKPPHARKLIEEASPGPRVELFSRDNIRGWDSWGIDKPETMQEKLSYVFSV